MYIYIFILIGILQHFKITLEMNFGTLQLTTPKFINDRRMYFPVSILATHSPPTEFNIATAQV